MMLELVALGLITLHGPDSQTIEVDPHHVTSLRSVRKGTDHLSPNINCIVFTTDGKNVNVTETCEQVHKLLEQK
jgi:hypothetical protein